MDFNRTWGAGVATVAFALVMTGCGTETAVDKRAANVPLSSASVEVERMADETLAQMGGDAEQREAQHYLIFRELNREYEECMQAQGTDFVAEFHTIANGYTPNGTSGTWMGALHRRPSDVRLANAEAAYDDATGNLPPEQRTPEFERAQAACDHTGAQNQVSGSGPVPDEASADFTTMLDAVERQLGPIDPYTDCMSEFDVDYTSKSDGEEGWHGLYLYLSSEMPRPPLPGDQPSEAWSRYLELEERSLTADAQCRGDQYEKGLELLGPQLLEFRDRYAEELKASSDAWEEYVSQAKAEGFTSPAVG